MIWTLEIATGPAPVFVTVMSCASLLVPTSWSPNESDDGESDSAPARIPFPLKETLCGLLGALSPKSSVADLEPMLSGVNATYVVHESPGDR
jgi:hypothetical protein